MKNLDIIITEVRGIETNSNKNISRLNINPRAKIVTVFLFLVSMLTFSVYDLIDTIPYVIVTIIANLLLEIPFGYIINKTKVLLLFVLSIAIFNPILDRETAFSIYGINISYGWLSFFTIMLRGYVSITVAIMLILSTGFTPFCKALSKMKVPEILVSQLMFVYRYIIVLLEELSSMMNSIKSRGYGRKRFPIKLWSVFIAQLLIKSYSRAEMINMSMISRGYNGEIKTLSNFKWQKRDTLYCVAFITLIIVLRFIKPFSYIDKLF